MNINSATSANPSAELYAAINKSNANSAATGSAADIQNRFMTLLLAQLQNQDPLNPLDNSEMTSQLSQLNMVNGIESLNSGLNKLMSNYADGQGLQAASVIGKNVLAPGNHLPLGSAGQSAAGIKLDAAADKVVVSIKDANGKLVTTEELGARPAGSFLFAWDGKDKNGNVMSEGRYTFSLEATAQGEKVAATPLQVGTVNAVVRNSSGSGFVLDLGDYGTVALTDVQQIL